MTEPAGRADASVENLEVPDAVKQNLKNAGICSIDQLEAEADDALMRRVFGCGPKNVERLRAAVKRHRERETQSAAPQPTGGSTPSAAAPLPSDAFWRNISDPKKAAYWVALGILGFLAILLGITLLFMFGSGFSQPALYVFDVIFAAVSAVIIYILLGIGRSSAMVHGAVLGFDIRVGGPVAGFIAILLVLAYLTPQVNLVTTVSVYAQAAGQAEASETASIDQFTVSYRGQSGQQTANGRGGNALAGNVPVKATDLEVDRVDCFGFEPVKQQAGESPPWKYAISNGAVNIQLVKIKPPKDDMPTPEDVRALVERSGLAEDRIRRPGKYTKHEVSLTIQNSTDRPITFVAYDCLRAYGNARDALADDALWSKCKDERDIQRGEIKYWPNFDNFKNPTGWFALFVRCEDVAQGREIQRPIGVFNMFNTRSPKLVIERSGEDGIGFRLNEVLGKLKE